MPITTNQHRIQNRRRGTSTLSATVALVLVTVAASLNVPPWLRAREHAAANDAIRYLIDAHGAQERFRERNGHYADDIASLDLAYVPPTFFSVGHLTRMDDHQEQDSWSLTLTRYSSQTVFSPYSITCTRDGFQRIQGKKTGPLVGLRPKIAR
jgi:type II secretory pathway pseudopilin PulG